MERVGLALKCVAGVACLASMPMEVLGTGPGWLSGPFQGYQLIAAAASFPVWIPFLIATLFLIGAVFTDFRTAPGWFIVFLGGVLLLAAASLAQWFELAAGFWVWLGSAVLVLAGATCEKLSPSPAKTSEGDP